MIFFLFFMSTIILRISLPCQYVYRITDTPEGGENVMGKPKINPSYHHLN